MGLAFPSELTNDFCISGTSGKPKLPDHELYTIFKENYISSFVVL